MSCCALRESFRGESSIVGPLNWRGRGNPAYTPSAVPNLSCFFAIYTNGPLSSSLPAIPGIQVFFQEMSEVRLPGRKDELFGPHASIFERTELRHGFLLGFRSEVMDSVEPFFAEVRGALLHIAAGIDGVGLDVLRLWPFPLRLAADAIPEELLPEDLFSVGFSQREDGLRGETAGLSKLGQRELAFEFRDPSLMEEAAAMCGRIAEWLFERKQSIFHGQSMSYGFERIIFFSAEGEAGGPFRAWHPPLVQQLLPKELFAGVGVLEVRAAPFDGDHRTEDLTAPLRRVLEQRLLLEELGLTGETPDALLTAQVQGQIVELKNLHARREEPMALKDSGWRLRSTLSSDTTAPRSMSLTEIARLAPALGRFLCLPQGVKLAWDSEGRFALDRSHVESEDEFDTDDDDL